MKDNNDEENKKTSESELLEEYNRLIENEILDGDIILELQKDMK